MNKTYKVIYSKYLGCLVVVSESAKCAGGKKNARRKLVSLVAASSLLSMPVFADDLPTGGQVVSGAASISSNGSAMTVNQSTDKMIANWQSFSIGAGNSVTFNQPSASSVALNRVVGQDASQILGNLNANGQVFLLNPNGVAIGASGSVQTGGFIASTLDISNENFLSGNYQFTGIGGSISNKGNISGRIVALIAPSVTNEGSINYRSTNNASADSTSNVVLAAGTDVLLDFDGDGLLSVEVKANTLAGLIENKGLIQTDGGVAILTAKGASDALKGVVNNSGTIQANTIASQNGRILLLGDMHNGEVIASGSLEANFVETSAATVTIDQDLKVNTHGGEWLIDPVNITINASKASAIETALASGNVTVSTEDGVNWAGETNGTGTDEGNIIVDASIDWNANTLTLRADNDITINAELTSTGTTANDGLVLQYAQTTSTGDYTINAPVNLAVGSLFQTKKGSDAAITYTVITDLGSEGSTTGTDLQGINGGLNGNYVLGANIDASGTSTWNSSAGFDPLGYSSTRFTGKFNGLGHTITNLSINRPSKDQVGLFGYTNDATLSNIGMVGSSVTGNNYVGGIVGRSTSSSITNTYATGNVTGNNYVGGLVGSIQGSRMSKVYATGSVTGNSKIGGLLGKSLGTSITNAYATGNVTGSTDSGGLVGDLGVSSSIINAYATGNVTGNTDSGGLIGSKSINTTVTNGYYVAESTGQSDTGKGTKLATIADLTAALPNGFSASVWDNKKDQTAPYLRALSPASLLLGDGTLYTAIYTLNQLQAVNDSLSGKYVLFNNIDASATSGWNSGLGFDPLGDNTTKFTGKFDGLGYTITDLTIDRSTTNYVGLFGITNGATIRNVGLIGGSITGRDAVGGLVGRSNSSTITNAYATGRVTGSKNYVGGLVGLNDSTTVTNAYATGSVSGLYFVGGLVGYNEASTISNAYATGNVSGSTNVGGLVGNSYDSSTISNAYATGNVSGSTNVGGLVGSKSIDDTVTNSYWNTQTSGQTTSDGGTGLTTTQMQDPFTFIDAAWNFSSIWGKSNVGENNGYMMLRSVGTNTLYDNYVGITGNTSKTYGDSNPAMPGFTANSLGEENITLGWGSVITAGTSVGNYTYSGTNVLSVNGNSYVEYGTDALTIEQRGISLSASRTYDGSTSLASSLFTLANLYNGETLTLSGDGSLSDKNAGSGKAVTLGSLALGNGTGNAANYTLIGGTHTADIAKASISAITGITASNKTYDGNTTATLDTSGSEFTGMVTGDALTLASASGSFADKNAATNKTVNVSGLSLSGADAANYTLADTTAITTADITKAVISAITGITANNKTYDGSTAATLDTSSTGFTGMVSSDDLALASSSGSFNDKNAGTSKTVTVSGLSLSGTDAANYSLTSTTAVTTADIAKAVISAITGITAQNKTYDGSTTATLDTSSTDFTGMVSGDVLTASTGSGTFDSKNAGTGKTVNVSGLSLSGADAANYTLADSTAITTADITKAVISAITGITASNKTYDGNTSATLDTSGSAFTGMVAGDTLTLASASGSFDDKNAGTGKTVNVSGLSLTGADAANYTLADTTAITTADISKAVIAAITGITANNKTYDGNTTATLDTSSTGFTGMMSGDDLTITSASGSFADKNAGENKTVTVSGLGLSGTDAANYSLASTTAVTTADIAKAVISAITGITATNKTYDGNTTATLDTSSTGFTGMVSGDVLTASTGSSTFDSKNAGTGKTVNVSGLSLTGADAANYTLADSTAITTADISKAVISAITGITASNKTYDGNTTATLDTSGTGFTGMVSGDNLSVASGIGSFENKNIGIDKIVNIFDLRLGGADASNYILLNTSTVTTADILSINRPPLLSINEQPDDWLLPSSALNTTQDLVQVNRTNTGMRITESLLFLEER